MNTFLNAELRLVKADETVESARSRQPLFFSYWKDRVDVFSEPTIFLNEKVVKTSASTHTWLALGYDLLSWFQWCQLNGINWRDAKEADRAKFAEDYAASSDEKTVNRKLGTVRRFYEFALNEGWYKRDIGSTSIPTLIPNRPIDEDPLAHIRTVVGRMRETDPLLLTVGRKDVVKPLQINHLRRLLAHLGPTIHEAGEMRSVRDRIICDLAYITGMRLGDVVQLTTLKFLNITVEPGQEYQDFPVIVEGKRKVVRRVAVPGWLVIAIQAYIQKERSASLQLVRQRKDKFTTGLFLGHPKSKSAGKPITGSAIQKMFALACMQCGITEQIEIEDEPDIKLIKKVPAHSFHDLRHTCAVLTYHAEKQQGNSEPWKIVQIKLGHKSLKTTIDTYLSHVAIFGEKQGITDIRRLLGIKNLWK